MLKISITSHVLGQENLKVVIKRQAVKSAGSFIKHSNRGNWNSFAPSPLWVKCWAKSFTSLATVLVVTNGFIFHLSYNTCLIFTIITLLNVKVIFNKKLLKSGAIKNLIPNILIIVCII